MRIAGRVFLLPKGMPNCRFMATGKKGGDREAELEAAIEAIRAEVWRPGQTLAKLRHQVALILQQLKERDDDRQRARTGRDKDPDT
jgi:uncharacterized coiled-coil protein SlyX